MALGRVNVYPGRVLGLEKPDEPAPPTEKQYYSLNEMVSDLSPLILINYNRFDNINRGSLSDLQFNPNVNPYFFLSGNTFWFSNEANVGNRAYTAGDLFYSDPDDNGSQLFSYISVINTRNTAETYRREIFEIAKHNEMSFEERHDNDNQGNLTIRSHGGQPRDENGNRPILEYYKWYFYITTVDRKNNYQRFFIGHYLEDELKEYDISTGYVNPNSSLALYQNQYNRGDTAKINFVSYIPQAIDRETANKLFYLFKQTGKAPVTEAEKARLIKRDLTFNVVVPNATNLYTSSAYDAFGWAFSQKGEGGIFLENYNDDSILNEFYPYLNWVVYFEYPNQIRVKTAIRSSAGVAQTRLQYLIDFTNNGGLCEMRFTINGVCYKKDVKAFFDIQSEKIKEIAFVYTETELKNGVNIFEPIADIKGKELKVSIKPKI